MRPLSLLTRALVRKTLPSSAFRPRIRNLAIQSRQPPGSQPAPRSRPYAPPAPTKQAPSPPPDEVSSFAKVQRKPGALPAGYKAAERRSVITLSLQPSPFTLSSMAFSLLPRFPIVQPPPWSLIPFPPCSHDSFPASLPPHPRPPNPPSPPESSPQWSPSRSCSSQAIFSTSAVSPLYFSQ